MQEYPFIRWQCVVMWSARPAVLQEKVGPSLMVVLRRRVQSHDSVSSSIPRIDLSSLHLADVPEFSNASSDHLHLSPN